MFFLATSLFLIGLAFDHHEKKPARKGELESQGDRHGTIVEPIRERFFRSNPQGGPQSSVNESNETAMQSLKVSLLTVQSGLRIFHSEFCETEEPKTINRGLRGWAEMRFRTLRDRLRDSQGKAARLTRKVVAWLHRWTHPDEALLS